MPEHDSHFIEAFRSGCQHVRKSCVLCQQVAGIAEYLWKQYQPESEAARRLDDYEEKRQRRGRYAKKCAGYQAGYEINKPPAKHNRDHGQCQPRAPCEGQSQANRFHCLGKPLRQELSDRLVQSQRDSEVAMEEPAQIAKVESLHTLVCRVRSPQSLDALIVQ